MRVAGLQFVKTMCIQGMIRVMPSADPNREVQFIFNPAQATGDKAHLGACAHRSGALGLFGLCLLAPVV